jgi:hypothetical protein
MARANKIREERLEKEKFWDDITGRNRVYTNDELVEAYTPENIQEIYKKATPEGRARIEEFTKEQHRRATDPTFVEALQDFGSSIKDEFTGETKRAALSDADRARVDAAEEFHIANSVGGAIRGGDVSSFADDWALQAGMMTEWGTEGRINMIKERVPGATFDHVGEGDSRVDFVVMPDGKEYALNKPGWSAVDSQLLAAELAAYVPAGRFAKTGKTFWDKVIRGAGAAGATDAGLQKMNMELGSGSEWDPEQTAIVTMFGGGGDMLSETAKRVGKFGGRQLKSGGGLAARQTLESAVAAERAAKNLTGMDIQDINLNLKPEDVGLGTVLK